MKRTIPLALVAALATASLVQATPAAASPSLPTMPTLPGTALPMPSSSNGPGAAVPFIEYEAENARTTGKVLASDRAFTHLAAEASGRRAVSLTAGQYVEFTLAKPANAVDVRYSVPDAADEAMHVTVNGSPAADLSLTAAYSHYYGNYPFTNNAADGGEHHYFDDVRAKFGTALSVGTRVRLQATGNAVVDLADFETVAAPGAKPPSYLDVSDFGADPSGANDSGQAIQDAINAASTAATGVWIPAGTFKVNRQLVVDQVTIRGAGPWYSVLTGSGVGVFGHGTSAPSTGVHLADFAIFGETTIRNDQISDSGLGGALGGGSTVDNLWIEHTKVGAWFDGPSDGLTLSNLRIQDVAADGINLHNGVSHTLVTNSFIRNSGDDGMAMWSDQNADHDNAFTHNTVSSPVLANGFAIYGGHDNTISDNIAADTVTQGGGVHVGNRFGSVALAGTTTINGDLLVRDGNVIPNDPIEDAALWFYAVDSPMTGIINVSNENIVDSSFAGIQFAGKAITNVNVSHVNVLGAGTFALQLQAPGSAHFDHVVAAGLGSGGVLDCASGFSVVRGAGNVGWTSSSCGFPPADQLEIAQATGVSFGFQPLNTSSSQPIAIHNPGPSAIEITGLVAPAGFSVPNTCATIAVGATCTLTASFEPTASKNYSGLLTIDSTSAAGPYVVGLNGVGFDPDGNLALGRTVTSSSQAADYFGPYRLVDGDQSTYFESQDGTFPQTVTLDLGEQFSIDRIVLSLPSNWGTRVETIAVSADGAPLVAAADYTLDPGVDSNHVTITFPAVTAQKLTLTFTNNTGWPAAQISEFEVYAH